jgi:deferrochelatase/peroxidase EfeB
MSRRSAVPSQRVADQPNRVAFRGARQAGVVTPQQRHLLFAAFDVAATERREVVDLLRGWTAAGDDLCAGTFGGTAPSDEPPVDSGEAVASGAARLTLTVGFGQTLFTLDGDDRFGIAARRPRGLVPLPSFRTDRLVRERCDGDLCVQACADDPLVTTHAIRTLRRVAGDAVRLRWMQPGFLGRDAPSEPRNLFGYKDGTGNPDVSDARLMDDVVWVGDGDVGWMRDGTYLVARRIHMRIERWDESSLAEQERTIGRRKRSGAPLSGASDSDVPDFAARDANGAPAIPLDSHIRLASHRQNGGVRLLRRSYNFVDGDDRAADFEAGLFFVAYQRDPAAQFVAIQTRLAHADAMNEYVVHTGSGVYACPPGAGRGQWLGQALFA